MRIKDLSSSDKPRERALNQGFNVLSDYEVIAIIIGSGYQGVSALDLAKEILKTFPLWQLPYLSFQQLLEIKGIKKAKALSIMASLELAKRSIVEPLKKINSDEEVLQLIQKEYQFLEQETVYIVGLNSQNYLIGSKMLFKGSEHHVNGDPKEILKYALKMNMKKIYLIHNHPSGKISPSKSDLETTMNLAFLADTLGITIVEHLILSKTRAYGILKKKDYLLK